MKRTMLKGVLTMLRRSGMNVMAQDTNADSKLAGAWTWQIEIPERPIGPIFGVATIQRDGTMTSTDTTQIIPQKVDPSFQDPFFTSASLGVWKKTANGYLATHVELLANPDSSLFAKCTTNWNVKVSEDGNSFSGTAILKCVSAQGEEQNSPQLPISGKRIEAVE